MAGLAGPAGRSRVPNGAWWTFASVMMMMLTAGTIYGFGSWNEVFKTPEGCGDDCYNFTQSEIELMGTMAHAGNYVVLDAGIITNFFGTPITFAFGCLCACLGYTALWASSALAMGKVPHPVLCIFCMIYGHGCGSIDNAAMTELISLFPNNKGNVVGCMKCYYGLATATITVIYNSLFYPNRQDFLIFLGIYAAASGLVFVPVIHRCKGLVEEATHRVMSKFKILMTMLVVFTVYFLIINSWLKKKINAMDNNGKPIWLAILAVTVVGMGSLFLLPIGVRGAVSRGESLTEEISVSARQPVRDMSVPEMIWTAEFWVLVIVLVIGQGNGLLFLNNAPQMMKAYSPDCTGENSCDIDTTAFPAMMSCFNGLGRLIYGNLSEALLPKVSRVWFLVLSCALLSLSFWGIFLLGNSFLMPAGAVVGFAYGGLWGVQPVILTEVFGPKQYGVKYACSAIAAFAGSLIFATGLAGNLYDAKSKELYDGTHCYQASCFNSICLITAVCGTAAVLIGVGLNAMTKNFYSQIREQL